MTAEARFWAKVDKSGECWTWTRCTTADGYGSFYVGNHTVELAHRYSWTIEHGPIPAGLSVLHRCDNPPCVRPEHLFVGTQTDNCADMTAKGRRTHGPTPGLRGSRNASARLTAGQVRTIRARVAAGELRYVIAHELGVSAATVCMAASGRTWGWLA